MAGNQPTPKTKITLCAELDSLPIFRKFIEEYCRQYSEINDSAVYDLKLALDEACTNIITHGYAGMNPGSIMLEIESTDQTVTMSITDFGHPFEPSEAPKPNVEAALEDRSIGGFGLFFIYQTMDEVCYNTNEDGNCLMLKKAFLKESRGN